MGAVSCEPSSTEFPVYQGINREYPVLWRNTWWLSVFTGALVIISAVQFRFLIRADVNARRGLIEARRAANRQSRDTKASIAVADAANRINRESMIASRRAWLTLEDVKIKHPTEFLEDRVVICITATVKNIGQSPATRVWVSGECYFPEDDEPFADAENRFKTKMRNPLSMMGQTLFQHDTLFQALTWSANPEKIKFGISTRQTGEKKIAIFIFVAVRYWVAGDQSAHLTHYSFSNLNIPVGTKITDGALMDIPYAPFHPGEAD